jgi:glyoxylase-like metal-dependent hydrolase (beta-lactamase superfamily II)
VHRIPLPLPNDGLRAVNVYALRTSDGMVLVDGGWAIPAARESLAAGLASIGADVHDVRRFLVTHVHRDHYTLAVELRREFGSSVHLGAGERPTMEYLLGAGRSPLESQVWQLRRLGAPALAERMDRATMADATGVVAWEPPDRWLTAGDVPLEGGRLLEAVHTPGHTAGHLVFHDVEGALLFAGDHVLPTITPSIGFEPVLSPDPLAAFLRSLAHVRERPDAMLLPAHGQVTASVHERVDELIDHHGRRLDRVHAVAEGRAACAADIAEAVQWTRRERALGELDPFNQMLAVIETGAHLDLLAAQGRLVREEVDGVLRYR